MGRDESSESIQGFSVTHFEDGKAPPQSRAFDEKKQVIQYVFYSVEIGLNCSAVKFPIRRLQWNGSQKIKREDKDRRQTHREATDGSAVSD